MPHKLKSNSLFDIQLIVKILEILLVVNPFVAAEINYHYSGPFGNELNNCYFTWEASNTGSDLCSTTSINSPSIYQGTTLTWKILTQACPELIYGGCADPDWIEGEQHDMTRDLVWDGDPVCGQCPRCPCTDGDHETYYLKNYTAFATSYAFQVSECYECGCDPYYQYWNGSEFITVYGRNCGTVLIFNSPDELEHLTCPPDYSTSEPTFSSSCMIHSLLFCFLTIYTN